MSEITLVVKNRNEVRLFRLGLYWGDLLSEDGGAERQAPQSQDDLVNRLIRLLPRGYVVRQDQRTALARKLWSGRLERPEMDLCIYVDQVEEEGGAQPAPERDLAKQLEDCRRQREEAEQGRVRAERELKALQGPAQSWKKQLETAGRQLVEQAESVARLQAERDRLSRECEHLERENQCLRSQLIELTTKKRRSPGAR